MVAGVACGLFNACGSFPSVPLTPYQVNGGVEFSLVVSDAESVAVVGNFNGWSHTAHPLAQVEEDFWSGTVPLSRGEHVFMFVVNDEEWVVPPLADDYVDDGFGQKNGVVVVP